MLRSKTMSVLDIDDILAQLKKGNNELDLGLVMQEEYDKLKANKIY